MGFQMGWATEQEQREAKQVVRNFIEGATSGDLERVEATFALLDCGELAGGGWTRAMLAIARVTSAPRETQDFFLRVYISNGDHIRNVCDDLALAQGLRFLLPKYEGPAMRLDRGESFHNRRRRTYGLSWTADAEIARAFAERDVYRSSNGGSVVLETLVQASAIICAPALFPDHAAEREYIVDRRRFSFCEGDCSTASTLFSGLRLRETIIQVRSINVRCTIHRLTR